MNHPLAEFRNQHHLSQDDLANICGITRQIITMTEQGIYPKIPPAIINGIKDEFGILSTRTLQEQHEAWINKELDAIDISPLINPLWPNTAPASSFTEWRNLISTSPSNFGKLLKIQPVTIKKYESGITGKLPVQLVDRLRHWGFSNEYIESVGKLPIGNGH